MENASKALIMAGSLLIALVIVSTLVIMFGHIGDIYSAEDDSLYIEQLEEYNRKFAVYNKSLYGSELLSLANLIDDYYNNVLNDAGEGSTFYEENKFNVTVTLYKDVVGAYDEDGNLIYEGLEARKKADISYIKKYNEGLEKQMKKSGISQEDYKSLKSLQTELKSTPFECVNVEVNKYGRIQTMHFDQVYD